MEEEELDLEVVEEGPQPVVEEEAGVHFQSSEKKQNKDTTQCMNKKKRQGGAVELGPCLPVMNVVQFLLF